MGSPVKDKATFSKHFHQERGVEGLFSKEEL